MGAFLLFLLILVLVIFFIALSLVGGILRGIFGFFNIKSNKRRRFSDENYSEKKEKPDSYQSVEGARRMRKFKKTAEDADYEEIEN
ncbi:MAG: hypothetical protein LBR52_06155 [Prevotellaceae bacterium]|jgi:hypothetical protein|nr:hypothetical protein [Prevotellaceae bacterium]